MNLHTTVIFVFVGSLSVPNTLVPLSLEDVPVGVCVLAFPVLFVLRVLPLVFEPIGLQAYRYQSFAG